MSIYIIFILVGAVAFYLGSRYLSRRTQYLTTDDKQQLTKTIQKKGKYFDLGCYILLGLIIALFIIFNNYDYLRSNYFGG